MDPTELDQLKELAKQPPFSDLLAASHDKKQAARYGARSKDAKALAKAEANLTESVKVGVAAKAEAQARCDQAQKKLDEAKEQHRQAHWALHNARVRGEQEVLNLKTSLTKSASPAIASAISALRDMAAKPPQPTVRWCYFTYRDIEARRFSYSNADSCRRHSAAVADCLKAVEALTLEPLTDEQVAARIAALIGAIPPVEAPVEPKVVRAGMPTLVRTKMREKNIGGHKTIIEEKTEDVSEVGAPWAETEDGLFYTTMTCGGIAGM